MGAFDLTKHAGMDKTAETIFQRQKTLFSLWSAAAMPTGDFAPHWVGMEGSLLEHLKDDGFLKGPPFDVDNMLHIPEQEGSESAYQLVLRPRRVLSSLSVRTLSKKKTKNQGYTLYSMVLHVDSNVFAY